MARRWAAPTRLPAPPPAPSPHRGILALGSLAARTPLLPAGPWSRICPPRQQLSFLTPRNWKFMSSALQPSVRWGF